MFLEITGIDRFKGMQPLAELEPGGADTKNYTYTHVNFSKLQYSITLVFAGP